MKVKTQILVGTLSAACAVVALLVGLGRTGHAQEGSRFERVQIRAAKPHADVEEQVRSFGGHVARRFKYIDLVAATVPAASVNALKARLGQERLIPDSVPQPSPVPPLLALDEGMQVTLQGMASHDSDGDALTLTDDRLLWENRGQEEWVGAGLDIDGAGSIAVVAGQVGDQDFNVQWFVRGLSLRTGATVWEDRFGPVNFGFAKDVAVEGERAFVAGWTYTPGPGYDFVVRAYDLTSGVVLWSREIGLGSQCLEEFPGFARCVAKAVAVHAGRVFVVGHLTRTAAQSDFAVLAFDARTGEPLWESVTDPTGTGANDYAWAVVPVGRDVFVLGEFSDFSGMILQDHDARTGRIRWRRQVPGANNWTIKETLAADSDGVYIGGMDDQSRFLVQAYDPANGRLRWEDHAAGFGQATALVLAESVDDGDGKHRQGADGSRARLFATGITGCNPSGFECKMGLRSYHPRRGLVWQVADQAQGGDWYGGQIAVGGGRLYVEPLELLEDGLYHPTVRSYRARDGAFRWDVPFDDGSGYDLGGGITGLTSSLLVQRGRVLVVGDVNRPDGGFDFLTRAYLH